MKIKNYNDLNLDFKNNLQIVKYNSKNNELILLDKNNVVSLITLQVGEDGISKILYNRKNAPQEDSLTLYESNNFLETSKVFKKIKDALLERFKPYRIATLIGLLLLIIAISFGHHEKHDAYHSYHKKNNNMNSGYNMSSNNNMNSNNNMSSEIKPSPHNTQNLKIDYNDLSEIEFQNFMKEIVSTIPQNNNTTIGNTQENDGVKNESIDIEIDEIIEQIDIESFNSSETNTDSDNINSASDYDTSFFTNPNPIPLRDGFTNNKIVESNTEQNNNEIFIDKSAPTDIQLRAVKIAEEKIKNNEKINLKLASLLPEPLVTDLLSIGLLEDGDERIDIINRSIRRARKEGEYKYGIPNIPDPYSVFSLTDHIKLPLPGGGDVEYSEDISSFGLPANDFFEQ